MKTHIVTASIVLAGTIGVVSRAVAEPIQIAGGGLEVNGTSGRLVLLGDRNFSLTANVSTTDGVFDPWIQCLGLGCAPGSEVSLTAYWVGSSLRSATATLDDQTFTRVGSLTGSSSAAARFTGSIELPVASGDTVTVSAPFVFAGEFSYVSLGGTARIVEVLQGEGTATLTYGSVGLRPSSAAAWTFLNARYDFHAVPEPATLVLAGSGIAALLLRRRRPHR